MTTDTNNARHSVSIGLSFVSGTGFTLMMLSIAYGVINGAKADANTIGLVFVTGLALLIGGLIAWYAVSQPPSHFDDISQPQYFGHEHAHDEQSHSETAGQH